MALCSRPPYHAQQATRVHAHKVGLRGSGIRNLRTEKCDPEAMGPEKVERYAFLCGWLGGREPRRTIASCQQLVGYLVGNLTVKPRSSGGHGFGVKLSWPVYAVEVNVMFARRPARGNSVRRAG